MVLPIGHLVVRASEASDPIGLLFSDRVLRFLWSTLRLALSVTTFAVVTGVTVAYLIERTDVPARRALAVLSVLPLVVPSYVGALALVAAFGPAGLAFDVPGLIGFWGATTALGLSTFPYVMLPVRAGLSLLDPALEEAARALGDSRGRAFRRAVVPQLRPAIAAGALLAFLYVLSDFGAVAIMRYETLTLGIFLEYRSSFDRAPAAVLGVLLVGLTMVAIGIERHLRGRSVARSASTVARPPTVHTLGAVRRWLAFAFITLVVGAGAALPAVVLGYWATRGTSRSEVADLVSALTTSAGLSAVAALLAVALAVPVAMASVRIRNVVSRVTEALATSGYALPGLVVALALVFFTARYLTPIYQTFSIVIAAYVIRFLPESLGAVRSSLVRVDPVLEDAARSLGRNGLDVARTVTLPLIRPGLLAGGALVFLTAMKELPATLLLLPAGAQTLATLVWTGAAEGRYGQAAAPALLVLAVSALVLWPLHAQPDRRTVG